MTLVKEVVPHRLVLMVSNNRVKAKLYQASDARCKAVNQCYMTRMQQPSEEKPLNLNQKPLSS